MAEILNFTLDSVHLLNQENKVILTIESSGSIQLNMSTIHVGTLDEKIRITTSMFGKSEGLPEYEHGVFYIVSQLVKSALPKRTDLLVPAEVQRDDKGNIIGCRSLGI